MATAVTTLRNKFDEMYAQIADQAVISGIQERVTRLENAQQNDPDERKYNKSVGYGEANFQKTKDRDCGELRVVLPELKKDSCTTAAWSDVVVSNGNAWQQVKNKKPSLPKCVTGTRKGNEDVSKVKASGRVRGWHIYVGNLSIETTNEMITSQLKEVNVEVLSCKLFDKKKDALSAHIVVPMDKKEVALSPATWTEGVRVRNWLFDYSILKTTRRETDNIESNNHWDLLGSDEELNDEQMSTVVVHLSLTYNGRTLDCYLQLARY